MIRAVRLIGLAGLAGLAWGQAQGTVTVTVDQASTTIKIVVPVQVTKVQCPSAITPISSGGSAVTCAVTLSQPAPAGGFRVTTYTAVCRNDDGSACASQPVLNPAGPLIVGAGATTWNFSVSLP